MRVLIKARRFAAWSERKEYQRVCRLPVVGCPSVPETVTPNWERVSLWAYSFAPFVFAFSSYVVAALVFHRLRNDAAQMALHVLLAKAKSQSRSNEAQ